MSESDPVRVSKTMAFLLRHRPEVGKLRLDGEGWVGVGDLAGAVSRLLRTRVGSEEIEDICCGAGSGRFELRDQQVRARPRSKGSRSRRSRGPAHPDILYHATTRARVERVLDSGRLVSSSGHLFFSTDESQAWRVAHRLDGEPAVLIIDTTRGRRSGLRIWKNRRNGLYVARSVPMAAILNLQEDFGRQLSAGGIPVRFGPRGRPQVALIRVTRRSGVTWEVAKGKLEDGEPPERAALREVREEMGVDVPMRVTRYVDMVRYGFLTPDGEPRLKSVYLYLMEPEAEVEDFDPMTREGIGAVRWFDIEEACKAVSHSSLIPVMRQVRRILNQGPTYAHSPSEVPNGSHPQR